MTFSQRLWELAISIPSGRVATYGSLAKAAGGTGQAARSVSSILSKAPNARAIPWHRIVYAGGKVWMDENCEVERRRLFKREGIEVDKRGYIVDFDEVLFDFSELT